jgi:hypothetical protein
MEEKQERERGGGGSSSLCFDFLCGRLISVVKKKLVQVDRYRFSVQGNFPAWSPRFLWLHSS